MALEQAGTGKTQVSFPGETRTLPSDRLSRRGSSCPGGGIIRDWLALLGCALQMLVFHKLWHNLRHPVLSGCG